MDTKIEGSNDPNPLLGRSDGRLHRNSETCPHCGVSLIDGPIPEEDREYFGGKTHFSRVIGVERAGDDYISSWLCPDCGAEDGRF